MSFVITPRPERKNFNQEVQSAELAELAAREAEIAQRVKRELAKARAAAEAQARITGHEEGFNAGQQQAKSAMQSASAALCAATAQLTSPLAVKQSDLADLTVKLATALAAHIIGCEVTINLAPITTLAHKLLDQAAAERRPQQSIHLRLHPADHAALAPLVLGPGTTIAPDPTIAPGGAVVEIIDNATAQPATIWDATIPTRLASLTKTP